jgi:hypothetical protein
MTETATEWGPARHDPEDPRSHASIEAGIEAALATWDASGELPDDN